MTFEISPHPIMVNTHDDMEIAFNCGCKQMLTKIGLSDKNRSLLLSYYLTKEEENGLQNCNGEKQLLQHFNLLINDITPKKGKAR